MNIRFLISSASPESLRSKDSTTCFLVSFRHIEDIRFRSRTRSTCLNTFKVYALHQSILDSSSFQKASLVVIHRLPIFTAPRRPVRAR